MMNVIGIDLGTTFCAVSTLNENGQAITLPNRDGDMLTPSAVMIDGNLAVVGDPALDVAQERPDNVATLFKRRMGMKEFDRPIDGRTFRPETLSAILLRKLAQDAEQRLGTISKVVITVPAYFDDTRRKATQDAGRIAGLDVLDVMDEPSAAALAYSFQQREGPLEAPLTDKPKMILVYDLGGGTFDVTLVRLFPKKFQTLAIEGDVRLGGKDFDDRIINFVAEQFQAKYGDDPRKDPQTLAMLQASAERAKRTLSKIDSSSVTCNHEGRKLVVPITRKEFESLTRDLLTRTRLTTQQVLKQAGVTWEQVDRVLLVGGSTHMPMTGQMLRELTGKPVDNSLAVSEVVARGAALHAGILMARSRSEQKPASGALSGLEDIVEISVNAHSLGVEIRSQGEKVNDILIKKNTQLPAASSRVYYTVSDGQSKVRVRVLQGEAQQSEACIQIGECWIYGLPGDLPKGSPIQVRCGVQSNGLVEVMALDMTSGKLARTDIQRSSGLTEEEITREAEWLKGMKVQ